jgi:hypothetical protein
MRVFQRDPEEELKMVSLRAPMLALTSPDPLLRFPLGTKLNSKVFLRNTTASALTLRGWMRWRSATTTGKYQLPAIILGAGETRSLDVSSLQGPDGIPWEANWAAVEISFEGRAGDLVAVAASVNSEGSFGLQTPFSYTLSANWKGGRWLSSPRHDTLITLGNVSDRPARLVGTLFFNDGKDKYELPEKIIPPQEVAWFDLNEIINSQIPDRNGKIIPSDVTSGSYSFQDVAEGVAKLFEGKVVIDKTWGHATYGCAICCPSLRVRLTPNPANLTVGQTISESAYIEECDGSYTGTGSFGYSTYNQNIATIDYNGTALLGVGPGTTSIHASAWSYRNTCYGDECCNAYVTGVTASASVAGQIPTSLRFLSATALPTGSSGEFGCLPSADYGIMIDIAYQVLDQNGNPINSATMRPQEQGTFFSGGFLWP